MQLQQNDNTPLLVNQFDLPNEILKLFIQNSIFFPKSMTEQSQIMDLSQMNNFEMMETIEKLLDESQFSKFTIILTRKPKQNDRLIASGNPNKKKTKYSTKTHSKGCSSSEYSFRVNGPYSERGGKQEEELDDNYHVGLRLYNRGQYEQALELFLEEETQLANSLKEGAESVKQYHDICFQIGNCFYRLKDYQQAIKYFIMKFEGEEPKQQGQKYNNLGSCYAHLDQERLSLNFYTEAFKLYSYFPQIDCSNLLNNLGKLYAQSGVYETAQKYFLQSIEERLNKSPQCTFLMYCSYMQLGSCQRNANKLKKAIQSFKSALKISERGVGDQSETLTQLATIYEMCQSWNEALNCYERLSVKQTKKAFLYQKAAMLHRNMGHFADYDRLIKQAFEQYSKQRNERKLSELKPVMSRLEQK